MRFELIHQTLCDDMRYLLFAPASTHPATRKAMQGNAVGDLRLHPHSTFNHSRSLICLSQLRFLIPSLLAVLTASSSHVCLSITVYGCGKYERDSAAIWVLFKGNDAIAAICVTLLRFLSRVHLHCQFSSVPFTNIPHVDHFVARRHVICCFLNAVLALQSEQEDRFSIRSFEEE